MVYFNPMTEEQKFWNIYPTKTRTFDPFEVHGTFELKKVVVIQLLPSKVS